MARPGGYPPVRWVGRDRRPVNALADGPIGSFDRILCVMFGPEIACRSPEPPPEQQLPGPARPPQQPSGAARVPVGSVRCSVDRLWPFHAMGVTMRRRTLLSAVAAAGLVVAGCGRRSQDGGSAGGLEPADDPHRGTVVTFDEAERKAAPPVAGALLDGTDFNIAAWRGNVVVLNWWASWCAPCVAEAPDLQAAHLNTRELGVEFVGVNIRDTRDAARAFHEQFGLTYPSLFDPAGRVSLGFSDVPPIVLPATLLLDRRLNVAAVFRRRVARRELEAAVRALATTDTG
jgi:thiol-disulfide isomerase/thioredoxin